MLRYRIGFLAILSILIASLVFGVTNDFNVCISYRGEQPDSVHLTLYSQTNTFKAFYYDGDLTQAGNYYSIIYPLPEDSIGQWLALWSDFGGECDSFPGDSCVTPWDFVNMISGAQLGEAVWITPMAIDWANNSAGDFLNEIWDATYTSQGVYVRSDQRQLIAEASARYMMDSLLVNSSGIMDSIGASSADSVWNSLLIDYTREGSAADRLDDMQDSSGVSLANDAITSAKIAADAIGASEIANNAIDSSALAGNCISSDEIHTSAANEIGAAIWDVDISSGVIENSAADFLDDMSDSGAVAVDYATIADSVWNKTSSAHRWRTVHRADSLTVGASDTAQIAQAVDARLSDFHGSGAWTTSTLTATSIASSVEDTLSSEHGAGSWTGLADLGSGSYTHLIRVKDASTSALIPGAKCRVWDVGWTTNYASASTGTDGILAVELDADTFLVRSSKTTSYNAAIDTLFVTADNETTDVTLDAITIPASGDPDKCTMYVNVIDAGGDPVDSIQVCATAQGEYALADSVYILMYGGVCDTTDSNGQASIELVRSSELNPANGDTLFLFKFTDIDVTRMIALTRHPQIARFDVLVPDSTQANVTYSLPER